MAACSVADRAYRYTIEDSVYIAPDALGASVGSAPLSTPVEQCVERCLRQMMVVISDSANQASTGLHAKHGFVKTGLTPSVGFKFSHWVDSVSTQQPLGLGDTTPPK